MGNRYDVLNIDEVNYQLMGSSVGTSSDVLTNFNATADRFRGNPISSSGIVTSGLVLNLDAANGDGLRFPGSGCSYTRWLDLSTSGITGTLSGFASCGASTGWNGDGTAANPYRLSFDRSNDRVAVTGNATLDNIGASALTIAAWIRTTASGVLQIIFDNFSGTGNETALFITSGNKLRLNLNSAAATSAASLSANTWYHVAATRSGSSTSVYINAAADGTGTNSNNAASTGGSIGGYGDGSGGGFFGGDIANVMVYSRALSAGEISQNCNALKARFSGAVCN